LNIQSREFFVYGDVVFYKHVFLYQRVEDTSNEIDSPNIHDQNQNLFTDDQPILNQPSQVIFTPCDNIENNVNDDHESDIQILKKFVPIETKTLLRIIKQHSPFK